MPGARPNSSRSFTEAKNYLYRLADARITTVADFARFALRSPQITPAHYAHGKDWKISLDDHPAILNPTEELILRITYELQVGLLRESQLIERPYATLFASIQSNGHSQRRYILRARICRYKLAFTDEYFPWLLNIFHGSR